MWLRAKANCRKVCPNPYTSGAANQDELQERWPEPGPSERARLRAEMIWLRAKAEACLPGLATTASSTKPRVSPRTLARLVPHASSRRSQGRGSGWSTSGCSGGTTWAATGCTVVSRPGIRRGRSALPKMEQKWLRAKTEAGQPPHHGCSGGSTWAATARATRWTTMVGHRCAIVAGMEERVVDGAEVAASQDRGWAAAAPRCLAHVVAQLGPRPQKGCVGRQGRPGGRPGPHATRAPCGGGSLERAPTRTGHRMMGEPSPIDGPWL